MFHFSFEFDVIIEGSRVTIGSILKCTFKQRSSKPDIPFVYATENAGPFS